MTVNCIIFLTFNFNVRNIPHFIISPTKHSSHSVWMWEIFCRILWVQHNIVMAFNNVMFVVDRFAFKVWSLLSYYGCSWRGFIIQALEWWLVCIPCRLFLETTWHEKLEVCILVLFFTTLQTKNILLLGRLTSCRWRIEMDGCTSPKKTIETLETRKMGHKKRATTL